MNTVTLAVASDLHCHLNTKNEFDSHFLVDGARVPASEHPIEALRTLIRLHGITADALILPGDFANKVDPSGYHAAVLSLRELATLLGAKVIVATLGNHDTDSHGIHQRGHDYLGKQLFPDFPIADPGARARFFCDGFCITRTEFGMFVHINSVLSHVSEAEAERGQFSSIQLLGLKAALEQSPVIHPLVCVSHHHPLPHERLGLGGKDLMLGGDDLLECLEGFGCDLYIHGHKHHPRLRYSTGGAARIPVFAAGSISANLGSKLARSCRNTFHLIELARSQPTRVSHGSIRSWELSTQDGWVHATHRSAGISHRCGFGFTGDLRQLAKAVASEIGSEECVHWIRLTRKIPELDLLIPSELDILAGELESLGLLVEPEPRAPSLIGKTV